MYVGNIKHIHILRKNGTHIYLTWILMMTNHEFAIPTNRTRHNKMVGRYVNVGFNCIKSVALDQIYHGDRR